MENEPELAAVGRRIQKLRKARQLSQDALAEAVDLHRNYIGLIERGERSATLITLIKLARALETPLASFFSDP